MNDQMGNDTAELARREPDGDQITVPVEEHWTDKAGLAWTAKFARLYPRSVTSALRDARSLATQDKDVAKACLYAMPRDGKQIEGPSVRFAEIVAASWGNLRTTGRIIEENDRWIVAQGECIDLERNNSQQLEIRRRITDKYGRRYSDDMIAMTCNAAISLATRNATLHVIPRALWEPVYQAVRKVAAGNLETLAQTRSRWMDHWNSCGVSADRVFIALNVKGLSDIMLEQIAIMHGWKNAINDGLTTLGAIFEHDQSAPSNVKRAALVDEIKSHQATSKTRRKKVVDPEPSPSSESASSGSRDETRPIAEVESVESQSIDQPREAGADDEL